ncbi:hypothetical protein NM688_g9386 [Phlebia brevispora]|uniref:Uncharacterized protein n=1 Tax=Phlebia brevispora TaxID=194682 RepID=A0ACC1RIV2_9APHY|nr:hypothetical protein NM688_g9386 [Phlebia brevispora]
MLQLNIIQFLSLMYSQARHPRVLPVDRYFSTWITPTSSRCASRRETFLHPINQVAILTSLGIGLGFKVDTAHTDAVRARQELCDRRNLRLIGIAYHCVQHDSTLVPDDLGMMTGAFRAEHLENAVRDWLGIPASNSSPPPPVLTHRSFPPLHLPSTVTVAYRRAIVSLSVFRMAKKSSVKRPNVLKKAITLLQPPQSQMAACLQQIVNNFTVEMKHTQKWYCNFCDKPAREINCAIMGYTDRTPPMAFIIVYQICDLDDSSPCAKELYELYDESAQEMGHPPNNIKTRYGTPPYPFSASCAGCMRSETANQQLSKCSRCKVIRYCSRACQEGDWPRHKTRCKLMHSAEEIVL